MMNRELGTRREPSIVPTFSQTPGKIWQWSVSLSHDNALVCSTFLGLTPSPPTLHGTDR